MTWLIVGAVIAYFAIGCGIARLWAYVNDYKSVSYGDDLRTEMVAIFFLWPALVPLFLIVQLVCWALFPERLR